MKSNGVLGKIWGEDCNNPTLAQSLSSQSSGNLSRRAKYLQESVGPTRNLGVRQK